MAVALCASHLDAVHSVTTILVNLQRAWNSRKKCRPATSTVKLHIKGVSAAVHHGGWQY